MAETSKIEWTDATWNPITGCTLVSEGCRHCYAASLAATRLKNHPSRAGLARVNAAGEAKFTGEIRFNTEWIDQPLRWRRPRRIFVCAHGDLFHENVPDAWIDRVFAVMALAPHHTFQVLTKRPERMRAYLAGSSRERIMDEVCDRAVNDDLPVLLVMPGMEPPEHLKGPRIELHRWPLANVWLGTSVEDQATADARIPHLLATPAAVRFVSAEPLLAPLDLDTIWLRRPGGMVTELSNRLGDYIQPLRGNFTDSPRIDWIIAGGESGPKARPMHPDWARALRDQCAAAGTAFLFKQWGEWLPICEMDEDSVEALYHPAPEEHPEASRRCKHDSVCLDADGMAHPMGIAGRIHEIADGAFTGRRPMSTFRIGKKAAGRTLNGVVHDGFPAGGVQ